MNGTELLTAQDVPGPELDEFLRRSYGEARAAFLRSSGNWWHRSSLNRFVVREDAEIAGYCAVIPTTVLVGGIPREAIWWVDLIVAPQHRGRGLQNLFDREILSRKTLKLGFPNAVAARIHRRHGWGVREDLSALLLPFRPRRIRAFCASVPGRLAAAALEPLAALLRRRYGRESAMTDPSVSSSGEPDLETLEDLASRLPSSVSTTQRSVDHLRWRYAEGPDAAQHRYYVARDEKGSDSVALIARTLDDELGTCTRILDVFGNLDDLRAVRAVVRRATAEALAAGSRQVLFLTSDPSLGRLLQRQGFVLGARNRFCWHTEDADVFNALAGPSHWVLGDSDNDVPESR